MKTFMVMYDLDDDPRMQIRVVVAPDMEEAIKVANVPPRCIWSVSDITRIAYLRPALAVAMQSEAYQRWRMEN